MDPWGRNRWGGSSPFFTPGQSYGGPFAPGEFAQTGAGQWYLGQNPEVAWTRRMAGTDPLSTKGQAQRGMWTLVNEGYQAALLENPNLKIEDYVGGLDPEALYRNQSQTARGENPGRFAPRARTISRGYGG